MMPDLRDEGRKGRSGATIPPEMDMRPMEEA